MSAPRFARTEVAVNRSKFSATCVAEPRFVPALRSSLRRYVDQFGLSSDAVFAILLAAGEAVANAVEHAYRAPGTSGGGLLSLNASFENGRFVIEVEDAGSWQAHEPCDERGRGFAIMRGLMTGVELHSAGSRTRVRMVFDFDERARAGSNGDRARVAG